MQQQLKQRLVGAVVLVGGAALLLPWLLGDPPPRRDTGEIGRAPPAPPTLVSPLPPRFSAAGDSVPLPRPDEGDRAAGTPPLPAPVPPPPAALAAAPAPGVDAVRADDAQGAASTPAADGSGWAIQLGSFSQEDNAASLREHLAGQGQRAFIERSDDGAHVRVLVGPFASRALAEDARRALSALTGLDGVLRETGRP